MRLAPRTALRWTRPHRRHLGGQLAACSSLTMQPQHAPTKLQRLRSACEALRRGEEDATAEQACTVLGALLALCLALFNCRSRYRFQTRSPQPTLDWTPRVAPRALSARCSRAFDGVRRRLSHTYASTTATTLLASFSCREEQSCHCTTTRTPSAALVALPCCSDSAGSHMTVLSRLLYGRLHLQAYDWVPPASHEVGGWAHCVHDVILEGPAPTRALFPSRGGNIHSLVAESDCAVLDVIAPPYSAANGRTCQYYVKTTTHADAGVVNLSPSSAVSVVVASADHDCSRLWPV